MRKPILKADVLKAADGNVYVKLIDIRSTDEYEKMHIPGAINIPAEEFSENNMLNFFLLTIQLFAFATTEKNVRKKLLSCFIMPGLEILITYLAAQQHGLNK